MVMIAYEWGSPNHPRGQDISPDHNAQHEICKGMSNFGGKGVTSSNYGYGTLNGQVYPVHGGMEDWAYAASWDTTAGLGPGTTGCLPTSHNGYAPSKTQYDPMMLRTFNVLVETSDIKGPPQSHLGSHAAVLTPNGQGDGEIPRNIRLALTMIELVQPYVHWTGHSTAAISTSKAAGTPLPLAPQSKVLLEWRVGGSVTVDSTYVTIVPSENCMTLSQNDAEALISDNEAISAPSLSGSTEWAGTPDMSKPLATRFRQSITVPKIEKTYMVILRAKVDQGWANVPSNARPAGVTPQSHLVNARTKEANEWVAQVGNHKIQVQKWWYSEPICVTSTNATNGYEWGQDKATSHGSSLGLVIGLVATVAVLITAGVAIFFYFKMKGAQGIGDNSLPHESFDDNEDESEGVNLCKSNIKGTDVEGIHMTDMTFTSNSEAVRPAGAAAGRLPTMGV